MNEFRLCETGKFLYERYCRLADELGMDDPRAHDAWLDWMIHKRGTPDLPGCGVCGKRLKIRQTEEILREKND